TGEPLTPFLKHGRPLASAAFSPDGEHVATVAWVGDDGTPADVRVWNAAGGKPVTPLLTHTGGLLAVEFSADGRRLVTRTQGRNDNSVRLWDAASGEALLTIDHVMPDETRYPFVRFGFTPPPVFQATAFSPDGRRLVAFTQDGKTGNSSVGIWDTE